MSRRYAPPVAACGWEELDRHAAALALQYVWATRRVRRLWITHPHSSTLNAAAARTFRIRSQLACHWRRAEAAQTLTRRIGEHLWRPTGRLALRLMALHTPSDAPEPAATGPATPQAPEPEAHEWRPIRSLTALMLTALVREQSVDTGLLRSVLRDVPAAGIERLLRGELGWENCA